MKRNSKKFNNFFIKSQKNQKTKEKKNFHFDYTSVLQTIVLMHFDRTVIAKVLRFYNVGDSQRKKVKKSTSLDIRKLKWIPYISFKY